MDGIKQVSNVLYDRERDITFEIIARRKLNELELHHAVKRMILELLDNKKERIIPGKTYTAVINI